MKLAKCFCATVSDNNNQVLKTQWYDGKTREAFLYDVPKDTVYKVNIRAVYEDDTQSTRERYVWIYNCN